MGFYLILVAMARHSVKNGENRMLREQHSPFTLV